MSDLFEIETEVMDGSNYVSHELPEGSHRVLVQARTDVDLTMSFDDGTNYWTIKNANGPLEIISIAMGGSILPIKGAGAVVVEFLNQKVVSA